LNHLAELFTRHGLRFTPQARTKANNKPNLSVASSVSHSHTTRVRHPSLRSKGGARDRIQSLN
jgi:hypothetical protein